MLKRWRALLKILPVLAGLVMFLTSGCGTDERSTPESTVQAFMKAWQDGDVEKMAALTGERQNNIYYDQEKEILKSVIIKEVETIGDSRAVVPVEVLIEDSGMEIPVAIRFMVIREKNRWTIDMDQTKFNIEFYDWEDVNGSDT